MRFAPDHSVRGQSAAISFFAQRLHAALRLFARGLNAAPCFFARRLRPALRTVVVAFVTVLCVSVVPDARRGISIAVAYADDVADEADLHFTLATERYRANDFRGALEHFLFSNRLVPNRNVVYNIARTYEQLKQYPDAFRYYTQALDGETDTATRKRIEEARARIGPYVAVLRVRTEPAGANVYLDRKDLGARGRTPVVLGLAEGKTRVIVELEGYETADSGEIDLGRGRERDVFLPLRPILGIVQVRGDAQGAQVRVDKEDAAPSCIAPCDLSLPPGRRLLFFSKTGFQPLELAVELPAKGTVQVRPKLSPITGSVVVESDVRDALVEIDGEPKGFTPAVVAVASGKHTVRVSQSGFRAVERQVEVRPNDQARIEVPLTQVDEVVAASRTTETVEDAPSSVTIISGQELRAMGYPTIAEALRGVRGIYLSDDRNYQSVGVRGFSRLGDYGNRVLVLLDGHPMNDNYIFSSYVGFDARTDLDDIERIEVVRGPGSVLYGTSAFQAVINLVTRQRGSPTYGEVAASAVEQGVGRVRATTNVRFDKEAGFWITASGMKARGADYFFREYVVDTSPSVAGQARGVDGFQGGTVEGRAYWKDLNLQFFLHNRDKTLPGGSSATIFGDPRNRFIDTRGMMELRYEPRITDKLQLLARGYGNVYLFRGDYAYDAAAGGVYKDKFDGAWMGGEARLLYTPISQLRVTAGGEYQYHLLTRQVGADDTGEAINRDDPFHVAAGYAVADWQVTPKLKFSGGARVDYYSTFGASVNPRVAAIVRPYDRGNLKILAGKAFRAPSVYELHYVGPNQRAADPLSPEEIWAGEVEFTHRFSNTVTATIAGYANYVTNLVELAGAGTATDPTFYTNSTSNILIPGLEAEVKREWRQGWMLGAQYTFQRAFFPGDATGLREPSNSPLHLASIKGAVPILGRALSLMGRLSVEGPRYDRFERAGDPPQGQTDPFAVFDTVLSGEAEKLGVRYGVGVYNAFDSGYSVPVSSDFRMRRFIQPGRTFYASLSVRF